MTTAELVPRSEFLARWALCSASEPFAPQVCATRACAARLGEADGGAALAVLGAALEGGNAAAALVISGLSEPREAAQRLLRAQLAGPQRVAAAVALAVCGDTQAATPVIQASLADPTWVGVQVAARGLGLCPPDFAMPLLIAVLEHEDQAVRHEAASSLLLSLGLHGERLEERFGRLRMWLASPFAAVRARGVKTLHEVLRRRDEGTPLAGLDGPLRVDEPSRDHERFWAALHGAEPLPLDALARLDFAEWLWTEYWLLHLIVDRHRVDSVDALRHMGSTLLGPVARELLDGRAALTAELRAALEAVASP